MPIKLIDRLTQAAQIHDIQDRKCDAHLLREARSKIVSLEKLKQAILEGDFKRATRIAEE